MVPVIESEITLGPQRLPGTLALPQPAHGLVLFVHGSGSSRASPRNRHVAGVLQRACLATLLFDLLTEGEESERRNVFGIELLTQRLLMALDACGNDVRLHPLPFGLFGASTGAAAALCVAARRPAQIKAVVSRGGRPDLADDALTGVAAPTLLIVGGADQQVLALNRSAQARMRGQTALSVIPGATHLFEEPGTLDAVAVLARDWFLAHLRRPSHGTTSNDSASIR